ncbi:hypothetical protein OIU84_002856 [Salix udensis]|uniref:WLM domain-containing protein n=1 Tax=Salix udensis TaxID=889485 RepID=A0AAD6P5U2_9ROSI|nr:hypothetical protein OIU84_002856 [Salix udensis]
MNLRDLNKVWEIKALKKPGEEEAKKMLDKIAKQVQPIMRKRNWRVKLLSEFCPNNRSLLGLNVGGGVHVKLRLRRPNRDLDFFPFHQVLDTMLHELCHNAHGPHNANFYKLWDELRKECEELISKEITGTGEGFDLPGRRLGGFSRQPALSSLRKTALAAAEKRAKLGSVLPSQPKRLGGDCTIMVALSPIQAAAMAAERRLQDEIWCGSLLAEIDETSGDGETSSHIAEKPCIYGGNFQKAQGYKTVEKEVGNQMTEQLVYLPMDMQFLILILWIYPKMLQHLGLCSIMAPTLEKKLAIHIRIHFLILLPI